MAAAGKPAKNPPLPALRIRYGRVGQHAITYELRHVLCGKARCKKTHGPYWYAIWKAGGRMRTAYVGKTWEPLIENSVGFPVKRPRKNPAG